MMREEEIGQKLYIKVFTDMEPVLFNRGYYDISVRYYFRVTLEVYRAGQPSVRVSGLCMCDKCVVLYGSEGEVKIFEGQYNAGGGVIPLIPKSNLPKTVVECVEPIGLEAKFFTADECCAYCEGENEVYELPEAVVEAFEEPLEMDGVGRRVYVTLGLFSIVKIEREVELMVERGEASVPERRCESCSENPCETLRRVRFPTEEFYPPQKPEMVEEIVEVNSSRRQGSGCDCR